MSLLQLVKKFLMMTIFFIIYVLSPEHDAFVVSLTTRTNQVKLQDVCPMLLAHECSLDLHSTSTDNSLTVNVLC